MSDLATRCDHLARENRDLHATVNAQAREIASLRSRNRDLANQLARAFFTPLAQLLTSSPCDTTPNRHVPPDATRPTGTPRAAGAVSGASAPASLTATPSRAALCRACRTRPVWDHRLGVCAICQHKHDDYAADAAEQDPDEIDPDPDDDPRDPADGWELFT